MHAKLIDVRTSNSGVIIVYHLSLNVSAKLVYL